MDGNAEHETADRDKAMVTGLAIDTLMLPAFQWCKELANVTFVLPM